jgi:transcriptional regulator with XRE-family HTH domain
MLQLPTNIKFIRELSGLTQQEFGDVLGVNKDKIYNLENGRGKKDSAIIAKVAFFAGVTEQDLTTQRLTLKDVDEMALKQRISGNKKVPESDNSDTYKDKYIALLESQLQDQKQQLSELKIRMDSRTLQLQELIEKLAANLAEHDQRSRIISGYEKTLYLTLQDLISYIRKRPLAKVQSDMDKLLVEQVEAEMMIEKSN